MGGEESGGVWSIGMMKGPPDDEGIEPEIIVRLRTNPPPWPNPGFRVRLGIAVPTKFSKEDQEQLRELEDTLVGQLGERGVLVVVLNGMKGGNFREFVSYVEPSIDFPTLHDTLQEAFPSLDVQMYAELDSEWEFYEEMAEGFSR